MKMKSRNYLNFLGYHPCCVSGKHGNVDLHHEPLLRRFSGDQKKNFDFQALPLDHEIHIEHRHGGWGAETFWEFYDRDPLLLAIGYVRDYLTTVPPDYELAEEALRMLENQRVR